MKEVELGEFEGRMKLGGQYILEFENFFYFPLKAGVYRKAGEFYWEEKEQTEGIGFNLRVLERVPLEELIVDNVMYDKCYMVNDMEQVKKNYGEEVQKGKKLIILPLFAFEEIEIKDKESIPSRLLKT